MKNKRIYRFLRVFTVVLLFAGLSFFAWGRLVQYKAKEIETPVADSAVPVIKYDTVVLARFKAVCDHLNAAENELFISGTLSTTDGADSTKSATEFPYVLNKKGQDMYCRLGETETFNHDGIYFFVDHTSKKMMISKKKEILANPFMPQMGELLKNLRSEGYELIAEQQGETESIKIVNDYHLSCKMYQIVFNPNNLSPKQISIRLSDQQVPEDKSKDKVMVLNINEYGQQYASPQQFDFKRLLKKSHTSWIQAEGYEGYELIEL